MSTQRTRDEYCQLIGLLITHREAIEGVSTYPGSAADAIDTLRYLRDAIPLDVDVEKKGKRR